MAPHYHESQEHLSEPGEGRRTRRTEGLLKGDRQERVVEAVLRATAEHLSRVGYASLRVEDVAELSGVHKTTIYRRWPSKAELVAAACDALRPTLSQTETGNLRDDLIALMLVYARFAQTPTGRGLSRILQLERADPEVEKITRDLRDRQRAAREALITHAIARGELPATVNPPLVVDLLFAPLLMCLFKREEPVDEGYLREVVDTVLAGVRARAAR